MSFLNDNITGLSRRIKLRIRWYGLLYGKILNPKLELKCKEGELGFKYKYDLPSFHIDHTLDIKNIIEILAHSDIPFYNINHNRLFPTLINRYKRQYLLSFDNKYRITIDTSLKYFLPNKIDSFNENNQLIIELKYHQKYGDGAQFITNYLPFRLTKSSKYVNGISRLY